MCCFKPPIDQVSGTRLFARSAAKGCQYLVYAMSVSAPEDVAMILPLPVPAGSPEDALRFISLKEYPDFFQDLANSFPPKPSRGLQSPPVAAPLKALAVVEVGDFEASFVPSVQDFSRLDERFRFPASTWDLLPAVKGYGFAVFKLKKGVQKVHPMAFEFPRANPAKLFFPTIHIHDGKVHPTAAFDHVLYAQSVENESLAIKDWEESPLLAIRSVNIARARGIVDGQRHLHRRVVSGVRKNEDILV